MQGKRMQQSKKQTKYTHVRPRGSNEGLANKAQLRETRSPTSKVRSVCSASRPKPGQENFSDPGLWISTLFLFNQIRSLIRQRQFFVELGPFDIYFTFLGSLDGVCLFSTAFFDGIAGGLAAFASLFGSLLVFTSSCCFFCSFVTLPPPTLLTFHSNLAPSLVTPNDEILHRLSPTSISTPISTIDCFCAHD
jgi:hypothetical protein